MVSRRGALVGGLVAVLLVAGHAVAARATVGARVPPLASPSLAVHRAPGALVIGRFRPVPHAASYLALLCVRSGSPCTRRVLITPAGHAFGGLAGGRRYLVELMAVSGDRRFANSPVVRRVGVAGASPLATPGFAVASGPNSVTLEPFRAVPHATAYGARLCGPGHTHCRAARRVTSSGLTFTGLTAGAPYTVGLTAIGDGVRFATSATGWRSTIAAGSCLVVDGTRPLPAATTLQGAVATATAGDSLEVYGTCHGTTSIGKNLDIIGQSAPAFGPPTLTGDRIGLVITVTAGSVRIINLTVTGGRAPSDPVSDGHGATTGSGGAINNYGTLSIIDAGITGNSAYDAGAAGIENFGTLELWGSTSVSGNNGYIGGAIANDGGTVTLNDTSSVSGNAAPVGGGIDNISGTVTLNDTSSVTDNTAGGRCGGGGGVMNAGALTLNDASTISGNAAECAPGGGVDNAGGTVTLNDSSSITNNRAGTVLAAVGGGIYNDHGTLVNCVAGAGGNVSGNTPDDIAVAP